MVSGMLDMTRTQPAAGVSRRGLLTAGTLALASAGCASVPSAVRSGTEEPEGAMGVVTAAGLYVAQQRGFFAAEGLTVTIVPTTGSGPVMADLLNGRLNISFGNYVSFIAAQVRGAVQLRILAEGKNATAHEQEITACRTHRSPRWPGCAARPSASTRWRMWPR